MQKRPMQAGRWRNADAETPYAETPYAETPYAGRPVEKRLCRNDDSETPMQQRHLGTLLHKSNAQRWV